MAVRRRVVVRAFGLLIDPTHVHVFSKASGDRLSPELHSTRPSALIRTIGLPHRAGGRLVCSLAPERAFYSTLANLMSRLDPCPDSSRHGPTPS